MASKHVKNAKRPDTKDHTLYNSIYVKCPEEANPKKKKVD